MIRRSVSSGTDRLTAATCCARIALLVVLAIGALPIAVPAQQPELPQPTAPADPSPADEPELSIPQAEPTDIESTDIENDASSRIVPVPSETQTTVKLVTPEQVGPPRESDDLDTALGRRGDLNLHGLTLNAALFTISEQWNINIVAGNVEGTVNGVFKQAPLREILDSILLSNGYNYRAVGNSLVVSSIEELGQINPFFQSATIPVRTADIDEIVEVSKLLSTPQGQVRALKSARSIVVLDFPDRVEMIRKFVAANDGAVDGRFSMPDSRANLMLEVGHYRTQYITARVAEQALIQAMVLSKDGHIGVLEKENRLLVKDFADNLTMVEKILERIDRPRPQVRITALIYDISLQDVERLGLNWNKVGYESGGESFDVATGAAPFDSLTMADGSIDALTAGAGNIAFGTLAGNVDINVVCHALQQARDARLLADPNVLVLDNEQAVFRSVREIPIQQLTETQQGGSIGTTAFRDAGIKLTVTPKIAADCTICMDVSPEFSRHVGNDENGQPIIDTREAKTTLRVANRQTIVIGGLRQREDIGDFNGIPYLKDMKLVGRLFRSRATTVRESELVVFIMPEIIECAEPLNYRQGMVEETTRCRLDQIPEAEGCLPLCRRLPPEMIDQESVDPASPGDPAAPGEPASAGENETPPTEHERSALNKFPPVQQPNDLPPMAKAKTPSAESQFGVAGRAEHVRALVADGRLRRLPTVDSPVVTEEAPQIRVADGQQPALRR